MALIKCPECGKQVSSSALTCPACGYPISVDNPCGSVFIKIPADLIGTVRVYNMDSERIIWQGKAGQVAQFDVNGPTRIGLAWGIARRPPKSSQAFVRAREGYKLVLKPAGFGLLEYVLEPVDVVVR